jgi:hypothetical protein
MPRPKSLSRRDLGKALAGAAAAAAVSGAGQAQAQEPEPAEDVPVVPDVEARLDWEPTEELREGIAGNVEYLSRAWADVAPFSEGLEPSFVFTATALDEARRHADG